MSTVRRANRSARLAVVGILASLSVFAGACAPQSPPASGGIGIDFGPLTIPLPPIEVRAPATTIPFGVCNIAYRPPGVQVRNATLTIPRVQIDPAVGRVTVPNVQVRIPQLRVPLSTITLNCLGLVSLPVQPDLIIPSTVVIRAATLDLNARTVTLTNPSFGINGAGIGILGLGDLVIPLPPIVNIPLPSGAIAF